MLYSDGFAKKQIACHLHGIEGKRSILTPEGETLTLYSPQQCFSPREPL